MTNGTATEKKLPSCCCCIVHELYKAAKKNPNKIAVIHAHGGAKIAAEFHRIYITAGKNTASEYDDKLFEEFLAKKTLSSHPPVYEGDECFTFSDIVAAVDSLSSRIRTLIDGGDDPFLIKPTTGNLGKQSVSMKSDPPDPLWPKERILSIVSSSKADFIIGRLSSVDSRSCHHLDKAHWLVDCSTCPVLFVSAEDNLRHHFGSSNFLWPCKNERLRQFCYLMYTSGSTGKPKGVCGTEPGLLNRFLWMQGLYPLCGEEILLFKTSVSFIDHLQEFLGALLTSCTLVVPPFDELKSNLFSVVDYLQWYSITRLVAVPSLMRVILPTFQSGHNRRVQDSLKLLVLSGEILHLSLWNMLTELLPRTAILNLYGSTEAFCDALMVEKVSNDDDFFSMGGDSISAAHASHIIGIDMRLLYTYTSPLKLQMALVEQEVSCKHNQHMVAHPEAHKVEPERNMLLPVDNETLNIDRSEPREKLLRILYNKNPENLPVKDLQTDSFISSDIVSPRNLDPWSSSSVRMACSFSKGNRLMHGEEYEGNSFCNSTLSQEIPRNKKGSMQELWKVHLESCVDASPLLVFRERDIYLYIGSHSYKFLCINAKNGSVHWEVKLEGRIECSAAILDDFSQVVVGCYKGIIYFLDSLEGKIFWTFQTGGEVKSQPLVDKCRHLVWCGSYDHNIYALDYRGYCCIYKLPCGGSIYGSPAIDEVHEKLYVAATSGLMTAISIKAAPFGKLWLQDLGAPVFGSLSVDCNNGNVICSLVSGNVVAFDANGSIIWRSKTGGPIFSGPCISHVLPSQVLICSRNGSIYSFELETGDLLWEYNIKDPVTSSAYADENLHLVSDPSHLSERLICVCASSGSILVLRISFEADGETNPKVVVQEFARLDLQGDIFSSPVMIGGRIFVGCRDDYVHCIEVMAQFSVEE